MNSRTEGYLYLLGFALCIPLANWMIGNVGAVCPPNSPCLIPVAPGIMAPSGVVMIGLALVLRDLVQRRLGLRWVTGAIVVGALLLPVAIGGVFFIEMLLRDVVELFARRRRPATWSR